MSTHRLPQMQRLQRVRLLEEESEASLLRTQELLRAHCHRALQACDARRADASRSLHDSLAVGDREAAMAAEMAMAFDPLQRVSLMNRLAKLDALIAERTASWRAAHMRRRQMDAVVASIEAIRRSETLLTEQKSLDGWFLMAGLDSQLSDDELHESFHREHPRAASDCGERRAKGDLE